MHRLRNLPLLPRTLLLVSISILLILSMLGFLSIRALHESTEQVFAERLRLAESTAALVDHEVTEAIRLLEDAVSSEGIHLTDTDPALERRALEEVYRAGVFTRGVFITEAHGIVRLAMPERSQLLGVDLSTFPRIRAALESGQPAVSELIRSLGSLPTLIAFVVPITGRDGQVVGLVGGLAKPSTSLFTDFLRTQRPPRLGYVDVVDANGIVLASTDVERVGELEPHHAPLLPYLESREAMVGLLPVAEAGMVTGRHVVAFAPVSKAPWGVVISQPESEVMAPVLSMRRRAHLVGMIVLLGAVFLTWLTVQMVVTPIRELTTAAQRLASGDLATPIPVVGRDEIATLGRSFDILRQRLQRREAIIAAWGEQLEQAVQERTRQLSALYAVAHTMSQSLALDELLRDALRTILDVLGLEAGGVYLLEPGEETLHLQAHRGFSDAFARAVPRISSAEGVCGQAIAERRSVVIKVAGESGDPLAAQIAEEGFQTLISTPLIARGDPLGVLVLGCRRSRMPAHDELQLLAAVGQELGQAVANARLYEREKQLAHYLRTLNQALTRASAGLNPDTVVQAVATCLVEQCGAAFARVWLTDESGEYLILRASAGLYTRLDSSRARVSISEYPYKLGIIARERRPIVTNQVQQDPGFDNAWARREGLVAFAGYPIVGEDQLLGVIVLFSRQPLSPEILDVLGAFVNQIASVLINARLYEAEQRRANRLVQMERLGAELAGLREEKAVLSTLVSRVAAIGQSPTCAVMLVDEETQEAVLAAQVGLPESSQGLRIPLTLPLIRQALENRAPILIPNIDRDAPEMRQILVRKDIQAFFAFPMVREDRVLGYITLSSLTPRTLSTAEIASYRLLADRAAAALENARLFEELERLYQELQARVRELSTVHEMGQTITATLRVEEVLEFVVQAAIKTVQAEGAYLFLWDEREQRLVLRAARGFLPEHVGRMKYRLGEGLAGWVFLEGHTANVPDLDADPRWKRDPEHEHTLPSGRANNALVVPLMVGGRARGVLGAVNKVGAPAFTQSDASLLSTLAGQVAIALENARLYEDVRNLSVAAIRSLAAAIDARDPYTRGHSETVARLVVRLGRELGWEGADLEMLEFAALLHDVGKIAIPDAILRKVGPLEPDDWAVIRLHPYHSAQIIKPVEPLHRIVPWVYHHHERWDGAGYPDGLKGEEIPLASRIIAVADVYSAMTSDRPYRRAKSHGEAIAELRREAGKQFDPQVVDAFLAVYGEDKPPKVPGVP